MVSITEAVSHLQQSETILSNPDRPCSIYSSSSARHFERETTGLCVAGRARIDRLRGQELGKAVILASDLAGYVAHA